MAQAFAVNCSSLGMASMIVPANTSGAIPVNQVICAQLPFHARKAFGRAKWARDSLCSDVLRRDLFSLKGRPLGTVFARELRKDELK